MLFSTKCNFVISFWKSSVLHPSPGMKGEDENLGQDSAKSLVMIGDCNPHEPNYALNRVSSSLLLAFLPWGVVFQAGGCSWGTIVLSREQMEQIEQNRLEPNEWFNKGWVTFLGNDCSSTGTNGTEWTIVKNRNKHTAQPWLYQSTENDSFQIPKEFPLNYHIFLGNLQMQLELFFM